MFEKQIPPAKALLADPAEHAGASPPRRAGKSFFVSSCALITGEARPESVSVIISLTLKQLKRIYWRGSKSGVWYLNQLFKLGLDFNQSDLSWTHTNGSMGFLISAEDRDRMEYLRGMEADVYLIDEAQAFAPSALSYLIEDILEPQRSSRQGRIILTGTPGPILAGPFFEATCDRAVRGEGENAKPTNVLYGEKDRLGRDVNEAMLWSRHHWTLEQNDKKPHQWRDAQRKKLAKQWADDHPRWLREYMGKWAATSEGLVFRYLEEKPHGRVTWTPGPSTKDNALGLPVDEHGVVIGGPWRLIGGLDLGFSAPTAFVLCAYSQRTREVRHVDDWSRTGLTVGEIAAMINEAQDRYGRIDRIFVDAGNLGKTILATLQREYGLPVEQANKREKFDHIQLLNDAFSAGEVKIIPNTTLEEQLQSNQWDLEDGSEDEPEKRRAELAKLNKLRENPNIPNDSTDALVYMYQGAMHHFGNPVDEAAAPELWSREWVRQWEREQLRKYRRRPDHPRLDDALAGRVQTPTFIQKALGKWKNSIPKNSKR